MRQETEDRIKNRVLLAFVFILLSACFYGTAHAEGAGDTNTPQITAIEMSDNAVKIKASGPIKYSLTKPADPFRVVVDIEGMEPGKFKEKIYSRQAGISEITPSRIDTPAVATRLDILLQAPSNITPEVTGDTLILYVESAASGMVKRDEPAGQDKAVEEKQPSAEGDADEPEGVPAKEIVAVMLDKTDKGVELIIKGDGEMPEPAVYEVNGRVLIDIHDVAMKASLPSTIKSPLKDLRYKAEKDKVRFVLDIDPKATAEVSVLEDEITVVIASRDMPKQKPEVKTQDSKLKTPDSGLKTPNSNLVSLDFQDADVVPILRLLGDVSGYNIVVHPDVKGKITMKMLNVPWEQAMDMVLKTFSLEKVVEGNVIRIATLKAFQDEKKAVADTKDIFGKAEDIETRVFTVNYANVEKVKDSIEKGKILSPRGNISFDTRTRSLIVKDVPTSLDEIQKLVSTLDRVTPQVLIDSRIVEISSNFSKSLGVEWGGMFRPGRFSTSHANISGSVSESGVTSGMHNNGTISNPFAVGVTPVVYSNPTLVGLAAKTTGSGPTSAITLGYLSAAQTFGLDIRLSAIEDIGKAKVISAPKIMTLENEQAIIRQGKKIPIITPGSTQGTYTTTYIDANLKIMVTPQVSPDGTIFLKIEINKDEPDYNKGDKVFGNPAIDTKSITTQVLVKDGETVVIGGIQKTSDSDGQSDVPGISKIPLLGWLFKKETKETSSEELLIFITPRIVK